MIDDLPSLPLGVDQERLRRLLSISGGAPNGGAAPLATRSRRHRRLQRREKEPYKELAKVPHLLPLSASNELVAPRAPDVLKPISGPSRMDSSADQSHAAAQQRNGIPTSASTDTSERLNAADPFAYFAFPASRRSAPIVRGFPIAHGRTGGRESGHNGGRSHHFG